MRSALLHASGRELARAMEEGHAFDPAELAGWVYRGTSLGLPAWVERLTWKKFAKAFDRDRASGAVHGWNVRVEQDDLDRPWTPKRRRGHAVTFGPFAVVTAAGDRVVLDYGVGRGPLRALRDPLVALTAGSTELLLGRSLVALGVATVATPSYFLLERGDRLDASIPTPAARGTTRA